jgi:hypothetical protein
MIQVILGLPLLELSDQLKTKKGKVISPKKSFMNRKLMFLVRNFRLFKHTAIILTNPDKLVPENSPDNR